MEAETLSIIVPVFNEQDHLARVIDHLMGSPCPIKREWIFIDDCSTDKSREVLYTAQKQYGFILLELPQNQGKGSAIIEGIKMATGSLTMIQDADFEYNPYDIPALVQPLIDGYADVVYGSRYKSSRVVHRTYHYYVNRFLTLLSNLMSGIHLTDMETCYKIFRSEIIQSMNLTSKRFGIEVELTAYVAKINSRIYELPIDYFPRSKLQGKKISWKDGLAALRHLLYFNFFVNQGTAFTAALPKKYLSIQPHAPREKQKA